MNGMQEERLRKLEDQAINNCLDSVEFDPINFLYDQEEKQEYCELYNMQVDTKTCKCGEHTEWEQA